MLVLSLTQSTQIELKKGDFSGYIKDSNGKAFEGVSVQLHNQGAVASSDSVGLFIFEGIDLKNDLMIMMINENNDPYILNEINASNVKLLFTGDLSFARRFMDKNSPDRTIELVKKNSSNAILKIDDLHNSGQVLIEQISPLFYSVDFPTVNFESIATTYQGTLDGIHPQKDYAYYTDSASLPILKDLNVSFVSLGNNHVFDYGSNGLADTIATLKNNSIAYSGAGATVSEAFEPYRTEIKGKKFSFVGATSIRGDKHDVLYVAHINEGGADTELTQGGAADAQDIDRVATLLNKEHSKGYFTVYQYHGGIEYTYSPNSTTLKRLIHAVDNNASLVIGHHPHTAQGYGMKNDVLIAYGLGNFIFDQDRLDTMLAHIVVPDIVENKVVRAEGYPIYIDNYIPKLLTGDMANRFIRQISEVSRNGSLLNETKFDEDFLVFPYQYKEYLAIDGTFSEEIVKVDFNVSIKNSGYETVDLRHIVSSEYSLSKITTEEVDIKITTGRDLLFFGAFEDDNVDKEYFTNNI